MATPNPMATPLRPGGVNGTTATPLRIGLAATPLRTPRDGFAINPDGTQSIHKGRRTPREVRVQERTTSSQLKSQFAALPKPQQVDWELELPEEQQDIPSSVELSEEDAAERDRRNNAIKEAVERADFKRRTQVMQKALPRPSNLDLGTLIEQATFVEDPVIRAISYEMALLVATDALRYPVPGSNIRGTSLPLEAIDDNALNKARLEIARELLAEDLEKRNEEFESVWEEIHDHSKLPALLGYGDDEVDKYQIIAETFDVSSHLWCQVSTSSLI